MDWIKTKIVYFLVCDPIPVLINTKEVKIFKNRVCEEDNLVDLKNWKNLSKRIKDPSLVFERTVEDSVLNTKTSIIKEIGNYPSAYI